MASQSDKAIHPRSLEELLRWSLKLSDAEMKDWKSNADVMSDERKRWLQEAMDDATKNDEVTLMISSIDVLKKGIEDGEPSNNEERCIALEQLVCLCDTIDMAKNFHKLEGFEVILPLLQSENSELRWRSAEVIASAVQNNPFCQAACHDLKVLPILFHLLRTDGVEMVKVKALYALSRLVNNFDRTEAEFAAIGGFKLLCELLASDHLKLRVKSAFMLRDQVLKCEKHISEMLNSGVMTILEVQLSIEADDCLEHLVKLAYEIVTRSSPAARKELLSDALMNALLMKKQWMEETDPERYEEEIEYVKLLSVTE